MINGFYNNGKFGEPRMGGLLLSEGHMVPATVRAIVPTKTYLNFVRANFNKQGGALITGGDTLAQNTPALTILTYSTDNPSEIAIDGTHGLTTGDYIVIADSSDSTLNKVWRVTVTDTDKFTILKDGGELTEPTGGTVTPLIGLSVDNLSTQLPEVQTLLMRSVTMQIIGGAAMFDPTLFAGLDLDGASALGVYYYAPDLGVLPMADVKNVGDFINLPGDVTYQFMSGEGASLLNITWTMWADYGLPLAPGGLIYIQTLADLTDLSKFTISAQLESVSFTVDVNPGTEINV